MKRIIPAATALLLVASCTSYKDIVYLQDINKATNPEVKMDYENHIKSGDKLTIVVSGQDKTVTAPYNLTLAEISTNGSGYSANPETATLPYLVDGDGYISFPKLGKLHVEGMTQRELTEYLTEEIGKDVKDPIVYVNIRNFSIHVVGEVRNPGWYTIDSDGSTTIFQALSRAGDLNLTAQRDGVIVLRDEGGVQKHYTLDLRSASVFQSPAYFVQQNDVIMVQPSPTRVASATTATGIWSTVLSSITTTIAVISLIIR